MTVIEGPGTGATHQSLWLDMLAGGRVEYFNAGGVRTRVLSAGDTGPGVFLLHGAGAHAESYAKNVIPLAKMGFRVAAVDMVGHGLTDKPEAMRYGVNDYVSHLMNLADAMGLGTVHIVGESLGGLVAMHCALTEPARVSSVVNVTGAGLRPMPQTPEELAGWQRLKGLTKTVIAGAPTWHEWRARMNWLVVDPASMPDEVVSVRARLYESHEVRLATAAIFAAAEDWIEGRSPGLLTERELATIATPVLYLWTDNNPTTPARVAEAAAAITPGAEFKLMKNCAHWPQFEQPGEFDSIVGSYIASHSVADGGGKR